MSGEEQGGGPRGRASALLPHPSPRRRGQGLVVSPAGIRGIFCLIRSSIYFRPCWVFIAAWPLSSCGKRGLLSGCGVWASHSSDSFVAEQGPRGAWTSVVAARGLCSCGSRALSTGSVAVAPGLSRSMACGIFSDQGWNRSPLHWQAGS